MNNIVVIIVSITLIAILGSVYLEIRRQIKPRIRIYFPDGSTRATYKAKEETNVAIHTTNVGRRGFPKPAATNMSFFVYAPPPLLLKKLQAGNESDTELVKAPLGGIFAGMHYLRVEKALNLFHEEEESITVLIQIPEQTGKQTIKIAVLSYEGDLGVHQLDIFVS